MIWWILGGLAVIIVVVLVIELVLVPRWEKDR